MTPEAKAYLNEALDYIQENSVKKAQIDWPALREEITALAASAQTPAETHPAIKTALERLGDRHSYFADAETLLLMKEGQRKHLGFYAAYPTGIIAVVHAGSPADLAGVQVTDRIETLNGQPLERLTVDQFRQAFREKQMDLTLQSSGQRTVRALHLQAVAYPLTALPHGGRLPQSIGYVELPALATDAPGHRHVYAQTGQQVIREIDQEETQGWILDLRRDIGGYISPMIIAVGPILGEGEYLSYVAPDWKDTALYRHGRVTTERWGVLGEVEDPYELKHQWPPVAVLTSYLTGSAGEFVALAFRGRPHTRSFGEATNGVPTGNGTKMMSDGAAIGLTIILGADRTGQIYDGPLPPDQPVQVDWGRLGTDDDPVLQIAIQWLQAEMDSLERR